MTLQCFVQGGQKASSFFSLLHLTCLHPSISSKASFFLETALSPQADMDIPFLCSYSTIRHFVPWAVTVNSVCLPPPLGYKLLENRDSFLLSSVFSGPSSNTWLTVNSFTWISEQTGFMHFFREDLWENSINYSSVLFVLTNLIIYKLKLIIMKIQKASTESEAQLWRIRLWNSNILLEITHTH